MGPKRTCGCSAARMARGKGMKITVPISSPDEVEMLAASGAGEFYCGIVPEEWIDKYSYAVWLNRRGTGRANLRTFKDLVLLAERARGFSIPVYLALNAPYYTQSQIPWVLDIARRAKDTGIRGLIISDVGLIPAVSDSGIDFDISLSSVAAVRNSRTAAFYRRLGVGKIIFPRHMGVQEIRAIRNGAPGRYEVFILNDGCVYEEGFCATTHAAGAFCLVGWEHEFYRTDMRELAPEEKETLQGHYDDYKKWIWFMNNCGSSFSENGLPNGPCGLCAVHDFYHMGIDSIKIVGREATSERKLKSLQMVRAVLDKVEQGHPGEEVSRFAMAMRGTSDLCDSGYMCYYRGRTGA